MVFSPEKKPNQMFIQIKPTKLPVPARDVFYVSALSTFPKSIEEVSISGYVDVYCATSFTGPKGLIAHLETVLSENRRILIRETLFVDSEDPNSCFLKLVTHKNRVSLEEIRTFVGQALYLKGAVNCN